MAEVERVDPELAADVPDGQRAALDLAVDRVAGDVRDAGGVGRRQVPACLSRVLTRQLSAGVLSVQQASRPKGSNHNEHNDSSRIIQELAKIAQYLAAINGQLSNINSTLGSRR